MKSRYLLILVSLTLAIVISGCSSQPTLVYNDSNNGSVNTSENQASGSGENNEEDVIIGVASVEKVQALILESFPVQVNVEVTGYLPDGCTNIGNLTTRKDDNIFYVELSTIRPRDALCTQALVPFAKVVPLDVYGLEKGVYTVDVNGKTTSFELSVDNILSDGN
jgi:inhibitor of cysteine peptidase